MTVVAMTAGLLPLLWSSGAGADVMKRIAAPMVGGLATSFALELLVYPALFAIWKGRALAARPPSVIMKPWVRIAGVAALGVCCSPRRRPAVVRRRRRARAVGS